MSIRFFPTTPMLTTTTPFPRVTVCLSLVAMALIGAGLGAPACAAGPGPDFVQEVQPILQNRCYECHGPATQESGLRLHRKEYAFSGGDSGQPGIVAGDPAKSRVWVAVAGTDPALKMPPEGFDPLTAEEAAVLERWIQSGADWPESANVPDALPEHWAFTAPVQGPVPAAPAGFSEWCQNPIDNFVLTQLVKNGLTPAPEADRYVLIRRVYLDLIGLPPSPQAVRRFAADQEPGAYERMVDGLLADPAFGERWARPWLDLARYADSKGYGSDPLRTIWRYRDWVIDAINANMSYDQFTVEQLAGDLLDQPTTDQMLATAFHRNTMANDEGGTDDEEFRDAAIKDRIDSTVQIWMGINFGCAKCHSHKYDPITIRDYYRFYAFFNQTEDADRNDEEPRLPSPTLDVHEKLSALDLRQRELESLLSTPPESFWAEQPTWEANLLEQESRWQAAEIRQLQSSAGTVWTRLADGSFLASGDTPDVETLKLTILQQTGPITGIKLQALPDPALPGQGPGRQPTSGNFVVNNVRLMVGKPASISPPAARYVRLSAPGDDRILSLAEVQVFSGEENLALSGTASQSSDDYGGAAERAVDGNTSGIFTENSTTHTKSEANPWWELALNADRAVDRLVIFNRMDEQVQNRLVPLVVELLDAERKVVWQTTISEVPLPSASLATSDVRVLPLVNAAASFAQQGWPAANAVDGDATGASGWAIAPGFGRSHELTLQLPEPVTIAADEELTLELLQNFGQEHVLGRFRVLLFTSGPAPQALPETIAEILRTPAADRTAAEQSLLADHYRQTAPQNTLYRTQLSQLAEERKQLLAASPSTPILRELPTDRQRKTHILLKSNFLNPGEEVTPATPAAFPRLPADMPANRLGVAKWLMDAQNPLTARVAVNRFWARFFGTGLVASEENFGTQGEIPTHPELLDWLAVEFMKSGWNVKAFMRTVVCSAAYRQSSADRPECVALDTNNQWLWRGPRGRLEAEMVRDQALALSGLLSRKVRGPSVFPPQPEGLWRAAFNGERTWATSTGDDRYRRGLYTFWRRTIPYPSMTTFDAPSREFCTFRRQPTNTPLQALVTLNDPAYMEMAQAMARRILNEGGADDASRLAFALELCLARPAHARQIEPLAALLAAEQARFSQDADSAAAVATDPLGPLPEGVSTAEAAAWTVVCNVLLNADGVLTKK